MNTPRPSLVESVTMKGGNGFVRFKENAAVDRVMAIQVFLDGLSKWNQFWSTAEKHVSRTISCVLPQFGTLREAFWMQF